MSDWLRTGMWPSKLDEMAVPHHLFALDDAIIIMKYYHSGSNRCDEWLVLNPNNEVSFIRRTKQLGVFWLAEFVLIAQTLTGLNDSVVFVTDLPSMSIISSLTVSSSSHFIF